MRTGPEGPAKNTGFEKIQKSGRSLGFGPVFRLSARTLYFAKFQKIAKICAQDPIGPSDFALFEESEIFLSQWQI